MRHLFILAFLVSISFLASMAEANRNDYGACGKVYDVTRACVGPPSDRWFRGQPDYGGCVSQYHSCGSGYYLYATMDCCYGNLGSSWAWAYEYWCPYAGGSDRLQMSILYGTNDFSLADDWSTWCYEYATDCSPYTLAMPTTGTPQSRTGAATCCPAGSTTICEGTAKASCCTAFQTCGADGYCKVPNGAYCYPDGSNLNCQSGICSGSVCVSPSPSGGACGSDYQCGSGKICTGGYCCPYASCSFGRLTYSDVRISPPVSEFSLAPGASTTLTFNWNTTGLLGYYDLKFNAITPSDADTSDNIKTVTVKVVIPDAVAPTVSVAGASVNWQSTGASASVSCTDNPGGSGCDSSTYRLRIYAGNPGSCPLDYAQYTSTSPQTISSHMWVCGTAKDMAKNVGFSTPAEFKIDKFKPIVNIYGASISPCTLNPLTNWVDCSATPSLGCSDAETGCNISSYRYKLFGANPVTCPSTESSYSSTPTSVNNVSWVCGYAKDNAANSNVSAPVKFLVNRTFTIVVDARAYGELDVTPGTEIKAYICESSQYYCNQDAQYLASVSGIVGADKKFIITIAKDLVRGTKYKIGLQTERGYAESEFTA